MTITNKNTVCGDKSNKDKIKNKKTFYFKKSYSIH